MKIISLADLPLERVSHDPQIVKKVIIPNGELPHLKKLSQSYLTSGQIGHAHAHTDMYEVFLIESGEGTIRIGEREYQLTQGTCVVVEPSEVHGIVNTGSGEMILTYFGLEA